MSNAAAAAAAQAILDKLLASGGLTAEVTYVDMAACCVFMWDYILTFDLEIQYIWRARWNIIKVIYIIQRYLPFIDSCWLGLYRQLAYHLSLHECRLLPFVSGFSTIAGIVLSEVLLGFRVYAVWQGNKFIAIALTLIGAALSACMFVGMFISVNQLRYFDISTIGIVRRGCVVVAGGKSSTIILIWSSLLAWNTLTMILMLVPGYKIYRAGVRSQLWAVLYRDGTYYFMFLCFLSILNIIFATTMRPALRVSVTVLERTLHSTLASRLTLHMREQAGKNTARARASEHELQSTQIAFRNPKEEETSKHV